MQHLYFKYFCYSRTVIHNSKGSNDHSSETPAILDCSALKSFWISWKHGYIEVGQSHLVGVNRIAHWRDDTPRSVHEVTVATSVYAEGHWEFDAFDTDTYIVYTPKERNLNTFWMTPTMQHLTFTVLACHYAAILLSDTKMGEFKYEVIIGYDRNRMIVVKNSDGKTLHSVDKPDLLSCSTYKTFWLTFASGSIVLGEGSDFTSVVMDWVTPDAITVKAICLTTGEEATGEWQFSMSQGKNRQQCWFTFINHSTKCQLFHENNIIIQFRFVTLHPKHLVNSS